MTLELRRQGYLSLEGQDFRTYSGVSNRSASPFIYCSVWAGCYYPARLLDLTLIFDKHSRRQGCLGSKDLRTRR